MIGLLTDYSVDEARVAALTERIAALAPGALVLDMMQSLAAESVLAGQRLLKLTVPQFALGSTLLVAVHWPGRLMALRSAGYTFMGPDNGLFTPWLPGDAAVELEGRDPQTLRTAAGRLAAGVPFEQLGRPLCEPVALHRPASVRGEDGAIAGEVLYADQFGNLITNIAGVNGGVAHVRQHALPVRVTYASAASGQLLALISSEGELEIALCDGSAAATLAVQPGEAVLWRPVR
jgi:S-adenosylmethionine hydrolase